MANLNLYKSFYDVVRYDGFTNASKATNISQPALSCSIKTLEKELNTILINRSNNQFIITEEGKILYANLITVFENDELFNKQKEQYTRTDLEAFRQLMFYINNDLEFGIGNWDILSEDEIIQVPGYPSYVSGEFIGQDKTQPSVKKMMKDRAKEHLKNLDS